MPNLLKLSLMLVLCFACLDRVIPQNYAIENYTVEDGLPSNEVFSITQDIQGYIWVATDKGICKFDGNKFITYEAISGLNSSVIYKIITSPLGGIVFQGADNKVGVIRNDSVFYFSDNKNDHIGSIYEGEIGIAVSFKNKSVIEIFNWKGDKLEEIKFPESFSIVESEEFGSIPIENIGRKTMNFFFQTRNGKQIDLNSIPSDGNHNVVVRECDDFKVIAYDYELTIIDSDYKFEKVQLSGKSTAGGYIDSKKQIWIGLYDKGVEIFNSKTQEPSLRLLDGKSVSAIYEDLEQTIWISTLEDGLFKLNRSDYEIISEGNVKKMVEFNAEIVSLLNDSTIQFYNQDLNSSKSLNINQNIHDLLVVEDTLYGSVNNKLRNKRIDGKNIEFVEFGIVKMANYRNQIIVIINNGLYQGKDRDTHFFNEISMGYTYTTQVYNDTIYTGRSSGLYKIYEKRGQFIAEKLLPIPVTCMAFTKNGHFLGTKGHGLLFTNSEFSIINKYTIAEGLVGNFVSAIERIGDTVFCGTNEGISLLENVLDSNLIQIYSSSTSQGLLSKNVTDIILRKGELFVATDKGVQKIKVEEINSKRLNPKPIIERINKEVVDLDENKVVAAGVSIIRIELNNIFFDDSKKYSREYRLLGSDSNWISTSSTELEFLNLDPGKYELQYRTKLPENEDYSMTKLNFELKPLFIQKGIFKILLGLFLLLISSFTLYIIDKNIRRKNKMILIQERLKYQALTAQLNPHFMFNALGSIQHLIITKQNNLAAENLASFSGLLDKTLKNTNNLFIPLADEMAFIDEYVEVEKSRFENPLIFKWFLSNKILPTIVLVPTMFLQPYIENSIIHGLNPKKQLGKIYVSIEFKNDKVLTIIIKDNGIGLKSSKKINRERKSMAILNIRNRIETMEKMYKNTFSQQIKEMENKDGSIAGTEVMIEIPYKLKR